VVSPSIGAALESNRMAVAEYVAAAIDVSMSKWAEPRSPGKWSPAQVTEHLAVAYELGSQIVDGTIELPGWKPPWFLRPLIRTLTRATVLRTGKFPKATTSAAFEPSLRPGPRHVVCERLRRASDSFEQRADDRVRAGLIMLQHPYYGRFAIEEYVRVQAYHTLHHRLQIL